MSPDKFYKVLDKLPSFHLFMDEHTALFRDLNTEPVPFCGHLNSSKRILRVDSKLLKPLFHPFRGIICPEKVIQRRDRIVQPDHLRAKPELRLLLLHHIDQIFFQFMKSHVILLYASFFSNSAATSHSRSRIFSCCGQICSHFPHLMQSDAFPCPFVWIS